MIAIRPVADQDDPGFATLNARPEVIARLGEVARAPRNRWGCIRTITVDDSFAGATGFVQSDANDGRDVELFCALLAEFEHHGIATEACRRVLSKEPPPHSPSSWKWKVRRKHVSTFRGRQVPGHDWSHHGVFLRSVLLRSISDPNAYGWFTTATMRQTESATVLEQGRRRDRSRGATRTRHRRPFQR